MATPETPSSAEQSLEAIPTVDQSIADGPSVPSNGDVEVHKPLPYELAGVPVPDHLQRLVPFTPKQREFIGLLQERTNPHVWPSARSLFGIEIAEVKKRGGSIRPTIEKFQQALEQPRR